MQLFSPDAWYGDLSNSLQKAKVDVISNTACQNDFNYAHMPERIRENNVCAYTEDKDACGGDSGGE